MWLRHQSKPRPGIWKNKSSRYEAIDDCELCNTLISTEQTKSYSTLYAMLDFIYLRLVLVRGVLNPTVDTNWLILACALHSWQLDYTHTEWNQAWYTNVHIHNVANILLRLGYCDNFTAQLSFKHRYCLEPPGNYFCTPEPGRPNCMIISIQKGANATSTENTLLIKRSFLLYIPHQHDQWGLS